MDFVNSVLCFGHIVTLCSSPFYHMILLLFNVTGGLSFSYPVPSHKMILCVTKHHMFICLIVSARVWAKTLKLCYCTCVLMVLLSIKII